MRDARTHLHHKPEVYCLASKSDTAAHRVSLNLMIIIVEPIDIRKNRRIILIGQGGVRGLMLSREPTTCAVMTLDARPRQAGRFVWQFNVNSCVDDGLATPCRINPY